MAQPRIFDDNIRLFHMKELGLMIGRIVATDSSEKGFIVEKPQFLLFDEEESKIYLTDIFDGMSTSTRHFFDLSHILTSGTPNAQLEKLYKLNIGEITEDEFEDDVGEVSSKMSIGRANNEPTLH